MKKFTYILFFLFTLQTASAQDDQQNRLKEKMVEYIQTKLGLNKSEAERFQPIFLDYLRDLKRTNQEFKDDRLELQKEIVELRIRYREQFKPIVGEKRSNEVFEHEREFVQKVREIRQEKIEQRRDNRANQRKTSRL